MGLMGLMGHECRDACSRNGTGARARAGYLSKATA